MPTRYAVPIRIAGSYNSNISTARSSAAEVIAFLRQHRRGEDFGR